MRPPTDLRQDASGFEPPTEACPQGRDSMSVDELTDSDPETAKDPLCPRCGQPINRAWDECELCGQTLTEAKR